MILIVSVDCLDYSHILDILTKDGSCVLSQLNALLCQLATSRLKSYQLKAACYAQQSPTIQLYSCNLINSQFEYANKSDIQTM